MVLQYYLKNQYKNTLNIKIVFINTVPTAKIFGAKVNAWWFVKNGFVVEFWDCGPLFWSNKELESYYGGVSDYRYIGPNHKIFTEEKELYEKLEQLDKNVAVFYLSRTLNKIVNDDRVLKFIQKLGLKLYFQGFETTYENNSLKGIIESFLRLVKNKYVNRCIAPLVFFGCGSLARSQMKYIYKNTNFVSIPSPLIEWNKQARIIDKSYIVFVDENLEYAPDAEMLGIKIITNIEGYYNRMRDVFSLIEEWTQSTIVIAASGKYQYKNNPFNREIFYGKTFQLMSYAEVIIGHSSSALNYNIKIKKPLIHLSDLSFTKRKQQSFQNVMTLFGKHPIMTHKLTKQLFDEELSQDISSYKLLENKYFREEEITEEYLKIIADTINYYQNDLEEK